MLKANKGDLVRILEGAYLSSTRLKVGDIVEISQVIENFTGGGDCSLYCVKGMSFKTGVDFYLCEGEFELFRKAGEEDVEIAEFEPIDPSRGTTVEQLLEEGGKLGAYYDSLRKPESDAVHHPSHYTQGKFETIEIIEAITQGYDDGYVAYSVGNALKYLARAPFKHASPIEDLRKAATYLEFAIKAYEAKEAE